MSVITEVAGGEDEPALLETGNGLRLEYPPEPQELREQLRDAALDDEKSKGSAFEGCFGLWLWERWRPALEPAGLPREDFVETVAGYRREIWYWLLGDRSWDQLVTGLSGRVSRRALSGGGGPKP
jgi:hypothetical protein